MRAQMSAACVDYRSKGEPSGEAAKNAGDHRTFPLRIGDEVRCECRRLLEQRDQELNECPLRRK